MAQRLISGVQCFKNKEGVCTLVVQWLANQVIYNNPSITPGKKGIYQEKWPCTVYFSWFYPLPLPLPQDSSQITHPWPGAFNTSLYKTLTPVL